MNLTVRTLGPRLTSSKSLSDRVIADSESTLRGASFGKGKCFTIDQRAIQNLLKSSFNGKIARVIKLQHQTSTVRDVLSREICKYRS